MALAENPTSEYTDFVEDSGEGRWTIIPVIESAIPVIFLVIFYTRFCSRQEHTFAEKMLSAMRDKLGVHIEQHSWDGHPDEKRVDGGS